MTVKKLQKRITSDCCIISYCLPLLVFPEKGVDKEYYTVGARLIRLEDKVQSLKKIFVDF